MPNDTVRYKGLLCLYGFMRDFIRTVTLTKIDSPLASLGDTGMNTGSIRNAKCNATKRCLDV